MLLHKDEVVSFGVTNCMSRFSMLVPTNYNVQLYNGNTRHAQGIRIILCNFTNCTNIYPVVPVYYCSVIPSILISLGALTFYVGFQMVASEPL